MSGIAKAVLCVSAGSVASEQLFSIAGLFDTVKRGRLNVETLESLTLLKANQSVLEELRNLSDDEESVADSDKENVEEDSVDSPRSISSSSDEDMSSSSDEDMSISSEEEEREVNEDENIDYEIPNIPIDG